MSNQVRIDVSPKDFLLNEKQAAQFLGGLSVRTLSNLRKRDGLPHVRLGKRVLYRVEALREWVADRVVVNIPNSD